MGGSGSGADSDEFIDKVQTRLITALDLPGTRSDDADPVSDLQPRRLALNRLDWSLNSFHGLYRLSI
jgi:hypothetical protein